MIKKTFILTAFLIFGIVSSNALESDFLKKKKDSEKKKEKKEVTDSVPGSGTSGPKAYDKVITKEARTNTGFFKVHKVKEKYFFELPDSILGRDILVVNRMVKTPVSLSKSRTGYPGDQIGENVIRFEKGQDNKIYMRNVSYIEQAKDTLGMYLSVKNANIQPIEAIFPIEAIKKNSAGNSQGSVIDVTKILNSDNNIFFFDTRMKKERRVGTMYADRSYIDTIRAYPINIEIQTVKTYAQTASKSTGSSQTSSETPTYPLTYELNSSMVLLPKEPMKPRYFDPRVGYFAVNYIDFDTNPQGIEYKAMITRWRLEPKEEDMQKYLNGELVEPKKPIVFYIDPATPKKWVPYLIAGVNDWQKAFEKAGFKNAIYALEAPKDSTWSLEDASHSAIVYKPSDIANASGPHVHDPRSGEIIETHVNWYHNVMSLVHNWYMIQAGAIDKRAQKMIYDDELMGQLIRFVSSHEVGHTLGLRHNYGSSATIPVEKLRDKAWVEANGHTPSIMDYARFNYVAQPEDGITEKGIFPRIGMYDEWAIDWGYRYRPQFATAEDEIPFSNKLIIEKLNEDKRYTFGTETDRDDPHNQNEDLGDNAMQAGNYGVKNLQRIVPQILDWTYEPNKGYYNAKKIYVEVVNQYYRYMGHVAKNVGGIYRTPVTVEENKIAQEYVPENIQKEAVQFLDDQLFTTPVWLIDQPLISKAAVDPVAMIGSAQKLILSRLISKSTIDKMQQSEAYNGTAAYTAIEMFDDLKKNIWSELYNGKPIDLYRRNLQKNYISALVNIISPSQLEVMLGSLMGGGSSDAKSIARVQLMDLEPVLKKTAASSSGIKRTHLLELVAQIDKVLDTTK